MPQPNKIAYKFEARVRHTDGSVEPFKVEITEPTGSKKIDGERECRVYSSMDMANDVVIYSPDDTQTLRNAVYFMKCFLRHGEDVLIDEDGREVELPRPDPWPDDLRA